MKELKAITLEQAYKLYTERKPRGFFHFSYADEMSFSSFIYMLKIERRISIL
jgi:hypothetical protein